MGVVRDREIHPGIAPIADSIEHNHPLMADPLMGVKIELLFHSPRLLSDPLKSCMSDDKIVYVV
jgi:hypothetical protein